MTVPALHTHEMTEMNELLENYFANTIIPQLFVDKHLTLRKFTPPAMSQFSLSIANIDQPIEYAQDNIRYPTLMENIREVIDTGEILEKEIQTTDKRWFQMNILPYKVRKENTTNGVIITFIDITKRIALLAELQKLNEEHETLLYCLTHDLRQHLTRMILVTQQLSGAFSRNDPAQMNKFVESLTRASGNMKQLLVDFIEDMKAKEETNTGEAERINIEQISEEVILSLRDAIYSNDVIIKTDYQASEIIFPRKAIKSILYNLLNNSIKYKDASRRLKISLTTKKVDGFTLLIAKDNGSGIEDVHHARVFEKFSRIEKEIEGTGIGLYIIKKMVEERGGRIELESELGTGSTFFVYFKNTH